MTMRSYPGLLVPGAGNLPGSAPPRSAAELRDSSMRGNTYLDTKSLVILDID
jgi:hypothetical protein